MLKPELAPAPSTLSKPLLWPEEGLRRVPYRVFKDPEIFELERERIFRGPTWNFLCLELDVPQRGDFRTTFVGDIPVVVTRDKEGALNAMVNRCAHKGALVCLQQSGNRKALQCVYHCWSYDLQGNLTGVAMRKGINKKGGMPPDFDMSHHNMEKLRVATYCGLIFGTFREETPPLEAYLGGQMRENIDRVLGKPLKLLGYNSQLLHHNWKMYQENLRDSYHATLLHTFYTTFKVNRLDMKGSLILSDNEWHHISNSQQATLQVAKEYYEDNIHAVKDDARLEDPSLLDYWPEDDTGISHAIQGIFPTLGIQKTLNSLAVRFLVPRGVEKCELFWMFLGYEDDTDEQTNSRIKQANLTGPAGYVSLEDGCIAGFVDRGIQGSNDKMGVLEMGGWDVPANEGTRASETAVRGFWKGYRELMGF